MHHVVGALVPERAVPFDPARGPARGGASGNGNRVVRH
jgi:hypothetical protein